MMCRRFLLILFILIMAPRDAFSAFDVDDSPPPSSHPAISPADGETAAVNPPAMIWRHDSRAAAYELELSRSTDFSEDVIRVEGIELPFYNHSETLEPGEWFWRYSVINEAGERSRPGPVRRFQITGGAMRLPVPPVDEILQALPGHPRVFTTPETLDEFRERKDSAGSAAWEEIRRRADRILEDEPEELKLEPLPDELPDHRRQVFYLKDGKPYVPEDYNINHLNRDAHRAGRLSYAYLISGDPRYAEAAGVWADFVADFRVDYHLGGFVERGRHDTVVYAYENGLKELAVAYDRIHDHLSAKQRDRILEHVKFHGEAAYQWIREVMEIHLEYQASHGQQCMHALLTTSLAVAGDLPAADEWVRYLVPQYVNRIAWMSDDGGYFEGHYYAFKFRMILEGLAAIRSATGIDIFQMPAIRNAGDFWLYCMSLNYWHHHWGDVFSLLSPYGSSADGYISNFLASMGGNSYLQWWSDTVFADPSHIPLEYLASTELEPRPPVDIAQARAFRDVGKIVAYERFYDHESARIFFRSSQWGAHSHAHSDQNAFVLHAGGEILAADVGYYSYYGDENHQNWAVTSHTHNTVLVNGQGQGKTIDSPGEITEFFHSPRYTLFAGDASKAYDPPLERFERSVLFIRPDLFLVYDELSASVPSEFSWLLNAFSEPEIEEHKRRVVVPQRERRLSVRHVVPEEIVYRKFNDRQYPLLTRYWTRYTDAFPEPWYLRVVSGSEREDERFLAVMHTYDRGDGERVGEIRRVENGTTVGVAVATEEGREVSLFRRFGDRGDEIEGHGISSDGRAASVLLEGNKPGRWMVSGGKRLEVGGVSVFAASAPVEASADFTLGSARGQMVVRAKESTGIRLWLEGERPDRMWVAPPERPAEARPLRFSWEDGVIEAETPPGEWVWWIEPSFGMDAPVESVDLILNDRSGDHVVSLEAAIADDGDRILFAELDPRESGIYSIQSSNAAAEILIQDHWDPEVSRRGQGEVKGTLREASEVYVRYPAGTDAPRLEARLEESFEGSIVSLLRNGDFEAGIPGYPPRGWTIRGGPSGSTFGSAGEQGWPGWTTEDAAEGRASLKFVRPLNKVVNHRDPYPVVATDSMALNSQPMRLRTAGTYHLRFLARGDATHARVEVQGARGGGSTVRPEPSGEWKEYTLEIELPAGSCQISIRFVEGGADDQVLWVDGMEFGRLPDRN